MDKKKTHPKVSLSFLLFSLKLLYDNNAVSVVNREDVLC